MSDTIGLKSAVQAYRIETLIEREGRLAIDNIPLPAGQRVEVIVIPMESPKAGTDAASREKPYRYDEPFEPLFDTDK